VTRAAILLVAITGTAGAHPCPPGATHHEGREDTESSRDAHWCWNAKRTIVGTYQAFAGTQLQLEGNYVAGKRDGTWTEWDHTGAIYRVTTYRLGVLDGPYRLGNREEGTNKNGKRHGTWKSWNASGKLLGENTLIDGNGIWHDWDPTSRKLRSEGPLVDDRKHGDWTDFYDSGKKAALHRYDNGVLEGAFTQWYASGAKMRTGTYRAGKHHGVWTVWYATGRRQGDYEYDDGKTVRWREWDQAGKVIGESRP
jgi:antitoxin component YwqK of YwqJK toxin-antitoxin module